MTLDKFVRIFVRSLKCIDIIKIDVEGAELEVLKGGYQTFQKLKPRYLLIENHLFKNSAIEEQVKSYVGKLNLDYKFQSSYYISGEVSHTFFERRNPS